MSNEIRISLNITAAKGYQNNEFDIAGFTVDMDNNGGTFNIQIIGTAIGGELIDLGDLLVNSNSVLGICGFRNIEESGGNFVEIGVQVAGTFYPTQKLKAGMAYGGGILGTSTLYARADTGAVQLQKFILEA